jgi:hypothetical protein
MPKVTLLSYTQMDAAHLAGTPIVNGAGTLQENLIEYAGRVCYRSDAKMGHNPTFIDLRVREGHEDIIEHVRFIFRVEGQSLDRDVLMLVSLPTVEFTELGDDAWIFSMNARNVRDFWRGSDSEMAAEFARLSAPITPAVFRDLTGTVEGTS